MTRNSLKKVEELASELHGTQKRKYSGDPYVTHTIRVANIVKKYGGDDAMVYAALLHDVLEDTPTTESDLISLLIKTKELNLGEVKDVVNLVKELTDVYTTESYPNTNRRGRKELEALRLGKISPRAQTIKYADLLDNSEDILRNDPKFAEVYLKEKRDILKYMDSGNKSLYKRCLESL